MRSVRRSRWYSDTSYCIPFTAREKYNGQLGLLVSTMPQRGTWSQRERDQSAPIRDG